jgi:hypothetical protein
MDRDVKRPVTNGEHDKNDFYNLDEHVICFEIFAISIFNLTVTLL